MRLLFLLLLLSSTPAALCYDFSPVVVEGAALGMEYSSNSVESGSPIVFRLEESVLVSKKCFFHCVQIFRFFLHLTFSF